MKQGEIKSNEDFWKKFGTIESAERLSVETSEDEQDLTENNISLVCCFDNEFPSVSTNMNLLKDL